MFANGDGTSSKRLQLQRPQVVTDGHRMMPGQELGMGQGQGCIATGRDPPPFQGAGLSLTQKKKKKNPVRYGVISKEPADSTCLHPGVPNCSTMSP